MDEKKSNVVAWDCELPYGGSMGSMTVGEKEDLLLGSWRTGVDEMVYRLMTEEDIERVIPLYMEYYNNKEDGEWTEQTTYKRIHQVFSREDSYCMVLESADEIIAFAMGYFEQYDDCFAYDLIEIVVAADYQKNGIGTKFMNELEARVKEEGAMLIQLQAVNDQFHEHFYGKLGYSNASNFVLKTKAL